MGFVILLGFVLAGAAGYFLGKNNERVAWNQLIAEGKLPKPRGGVKTAWNPLTQTWEKV